MLSFQSTLDEAHKKDCMWQPILTQSRTAISTRPPIFVLWFPWHSCSSQTLSFDPEWRFKYSKGFLQEAHSCQPAALECSALERRGGLHVKLGAPQMYQCILHIFQPLETYLNPKGWKQVQKYKNDVFTPAVWPPTTKWPILTTWLAVIDILRLGVQMSSLQKYTILITSLLVVALNFNPKNYIFLSEKALLVHQNSVWIVDILTNGIIFYIRYFSREMGK